MDDSATPLNLAELAFLRALDELAPRYLVVGMSAALMQGVRGSTDDIDLWFESISDPRIGEAARRAGGFLVTRAQPPLLGGPFGERFDIVTHMDGLPDFSAEYASATVAELAGIKLRLLPLERILVSKRAANRAKDKIAIGQIEQTLRVLAALKAE